MTSDCFFEDAPLVSQPPLIIDGTDFEIFEKDILGHGSHGVLYRGRDRLSSRNVAVRVLPADAQVSHALLTWLRNHADLLAPLGADGIVPILGSGEWRGKVFYAMELVQGESLAHCIAQAHRFTTDEIIHVAEAVVGGLRAASKSGLAPCGIKPSNVFLTSSGTVRITEIGLAKGISEAAQVPVSRWQGRYVAPEQISGEPPDIRSDLYSLGVILYELATRRLPFEGYDSITSFHYQLLQVDPVAPRELGASITRELERVVLRCLARAPSLRYQAPDDLLEDLQSVRRGQGSSVAVGGLPEDDPGDFDIYEDQQIGEGGMGIIYRARQHSLGRPVAVKVIRDVFTARPEFVKRFRQEAELLAQVNHPNVIQVFGTGTWHGRLFYAMELVEGQDVATRLRERKRFTPDEVLHVAEEVAHALAAAWKFRIVHRDIKPSNILMTPQGAIKVADFGLAKSLRIPKSDSRLIAGTSEYISPEQGMGEAVDIRSDIYSLGVVLYELLMGRPPFQSDGTFTFVLYQHVHSMPPEMEALTGTIPGPVKEIIQKCLEKMPARRFQTPEELLSAILKARKSMEDREQPTGDSAQPDQDRPGGSRPPGPVPRARPRHRGHRRPAQDPPRPRSGGRTDRSKTAAPPSKGSSEYGLLLGMGEYQEAMKVAEARWGKASKQFKAAAARQSESLRQDFELRGREALRLRDWRGASEALGMSLQGAPPDRARELKAALQLSDDLIRAQELERNGRNPEALEIYLLYSDRVPSLQDYIRDRMARVQRAK
jgi:serine/threonine protein kinase